MKILFSLIISMTFAFSINLEGLLQNVKAESSKELELEKQRLQEFVKNKNEQDNLLKKVKAELKAEEEMSKNLEKNIESNESILTQKETELSSKATDLGEMFGSVRQTSSDFLATYENSLTASQDPAKQEIFSKLSESKKLANIEELTQFWHIMLDEILQSGNIAKYNTTIISKNGEKINKEITRIGLFAAVSEGKYLKYSNDMKSLVEFTVQPSSAIVNTAKDFENSTSISSIVIDPTRGTLFEMIEYKPTLGDRIKQGGFVGYTIIILGILGVLFALYRIFILSTYSTKINAQLKSLDQKDVNTSNSLGKIADIFYKNINDPIADLELKIGEAIITEVNDIKKGQSFVKLLASVTPLLGLLGTVTGMIQTFQAITLFGTGDPKLMAGGISTALITTVLGLVAAIPLLFLSTYIASKSERLVSILEEQSVGLLAKAIK